MPSTSSPVVNRLADRVRQAVTVVHDLRKEKERLTSELALMTEENRRARRLLQEHEDLVAERQRLRERLEKVVQKLGKLKI